MVWEEMIEIGEQLNGRELLGQASGRAGKKCVNHKEKLGLYREEQQRARACGGE